MDNFDPLWETDIIGMYLQNQEFDSLGFDDTLSSYYDYDSSSPDGCASSMTSKNIVSERKRRQKLNERLFALRAVVPNITKMDKASIIKDAISYIKELHEQERRIKSDISDLEHRRSKNGNNNSCSMMDYDQELPFVQIKSKKKRTDHRKQQQQQHYDSNGCYRSSVIDDLEVRVSYVGERTIVVSLTCSKREGTMVKLCEMFESLKLKIITAHITAFAGRLLKTVFLESRHIRRADDCLVSLSSLHVVSSTPVVAETTSDSTRLGV
ncbi:hypothetical protein SOVF_104590 isoform A [Spinacia oleracea]|nr:hypothetical protein SOVF_104590 isoform A [Spinacia oleracea]